MKSNLFEINKDLEGILSQVKCFALDMDGTIYLGERWIEGAKAFLERIEASGRSYVFVTNNSSKNAAVYVEKLKRMGLSVGEEKIVTSGQATIHYLKQQFPGRRVFLLGNTLLREEFSQAGILLEEDNPDVVVTAFDTSFTWTKLCRLCDFIRAGIPYIGTHPDYNCTTKTGFVPDIGALFAYVQASAGRMPDKIVGKPNREIIDYMLNVMGAEPKNTAVVGDRLYTDVQSGISNGLCGILVLSGEVQLAELPDAKVKPHLIFDSVKEITRLL